MSAFLDTSMLVRYLTGDPPEQAQQVAAVIDQEEGLVLTEVVLAETANVLTTIYKVSREVVVDHLILFLQKQNIVSFAVHKDFLLQALLLCRQSGRVSFADAMLWAAVRASSEKRVHSLDERFPRDGVKVLREKR